MINSYRLIDCLKSVSKIKVSSDDIENIELLSKNFSISIFQTLKKNKILFLFLYHCNNYDFGKNIEDNLWGQCSESFLSLQIKYREYIETIQTIINEFDSNNINYVLIKGFSFMHSLYYLNDSICRPFSDVDFLVKKEDLSLVNKILNDKGYIQGYINGNNIIPAKREEIIFWLLYSHQTYEYVQFSQFANLSNYFRKYVDINTTIFEGGLKTSPITTQTLIKKTVVKPVYNNFKACIFNYTYGLIHLCYHFYKDTKYTEKEKTHDNYSLMKFCDIREYIIKHNHEIDWNEYHNISINYSIQCELYEPIFLVGMFFQDDFLLEIVRNNNGIEMFADGFSFSKRYWKEIFL